MYPHNGHPSAAGRAQGRVSSPAKDRRSAHCATQPTDAAPSVSLPTDVGRETDGAAVLKERLPKDVRLKGTCRNGPDDDRSDRVLLRVVMWRLMQILRH